mmetsp:Transcript_9877/g.21703  ORF Transcript_9877/g.21703 Transcript_9877/m.21703 type:complete len:304 (-) Transcript_9877:249-1160(-)
MSFQIAELSDTDDVPEEVVFDQNPVRCICPHCQKRIMTFVDYQTTFKTYLVALACFACIGWFSVCVMPILWSLLKDAVHHCPRCLSVIETRSQISLPSVTEEVMTFRVGSCAMVLSRRYVLLFVALVMLIVGGYHLRTAGLAVEAAEVPPGDPSNKTWAQFQQDCGFRSSLGNPIRASAAFERDYHHRLFAWAGRVLKVNAGFNLLVWQQPSFVLVRMDPPQFQYRDQADLVLSFGVKFQQTVNELHEGDHLSFNATMLALGKRGAPSTMAIATLLVGPPEIHQEEVIQEVQAESTEQPGDPP